jgi:hypothetical protein
MPFEDVRHAIRAVAAVGNYALAFDLSVRAGLWVCLHCADDLRPKNDYLSGETLSSMGINSDGRICFSCRTKIVKTSENSYPIRY